MIDPVNGRPINAGEFVPTAERFGLARNLDRWVVTRALGLIASGRHVSANISAATISDRTLTELVETSLAETGADPSLLTFEITETAATPAIESLRDFTGRVEALGCGLSLDDVGTGFGSLTYLRHLPFTELKIDMQFVHGVLESDADRKIVKSLVDIATGLGMRTVAEGRRQPGARGAASRARRHLCTGLPVRPALPRSGRRLSRSPAGRPGPSRATA